MDKFWNQSLTRRLLKLLVLGFIINAAVYVTVLHFGKLLLEDFFGGSSFIYDSQQKDIDALQAFVAENGVSADDYELLRDWTYHEKIDRLTVSRDRILLCDTGYTGFSFDNHLETEYLNRNWMYFHDVVFSDGSADVFIYNDYADSIYYLFYTGALGFCFFLFMVIFSIGLRKELKYINVLNQNVRMIESGEWRQAVPVRGQDELGSLASGLDHMRQSLIENKEREKEMKKAQDKLVVGMAHDLRNPMTGLMTYLELAKKNPSAEEAGSYIEKAVSKTFEIRDLSDHLFDYFRIHSDEQPQLEEPGMVKSVVGDYLSELYMLLNAAGFIVNTETLTWPEAETRIYTDYMSRIVNNLFSNIVKYADPEHEVIMGSVCEAQWFKISLSNHYSPDRQVIEKNGIGVDNISEMMRRMGGVCTAEMTEDYYRITLAFPICG